MRLNKVLELLDLLDSLGLGVFHLESFVLGVSEKQHACLLILVCVGITEDSRGYFGHLCKLHFGVLQERGLVDHSLEKRHYYWFILIY